jgi:hypothetical protein
MSAELYIEKMLASAALLPMLRRAIAMGIIKEKATELRGISNAR